MTNKNKLNLEQVLEVVKEKYKDAEIKHITEIHSRCEREMIRDEGGWETDNYIDIEVPYEELVAYSIVGTPFEILYNGNLRVNGINIDNIIELKHYLDIDIEWEDLLKEFKELISLCYKNVIEDGTTRFYDDGTIETPEITIATNRSYWQMYNIIKNLTE